MLDEVITATVGATETDFQLVVRARTGDRNAFNQLVTRYERPVLAVALIVVRCPEDARDVAQDVFVTAYRKLNGFWGPRNFGPWALQIARRRALRYRKRQSRRSFQPLSPEFPDPRKQRSMSGTMAEALELIARLPRHEQVVVMLRFLDGLEMEQIARATGRPVGTVTKQLSRAHKRLRRWIGEEVNCE